MSTLNSIIKDAKSLTNAEIEVLFDNIGELLSLKSISASIHANSREQIKGFRKHETGFEQISAHSNTDNKEVHGFCYLSAHILAHI